MVQPNPVVTTATTLVVAPGGGTIAAGGSFTLTAFVTPANGSTIPAGFVLFTVGSTTVQATLDATGLATYVGTATCSANTEGFQAVYEPTSSFAPSQSSPVTVSITGACVLPATTTELVINPSGSTLNGGESYTLSFAVRSASPACMPSGTVTLSIGATTQTVPLNSSGAGTVAEVAPSSAGPLAISAVYGGSATCAGSLSNIIDLSVAPAVAAGLTISASPTSVTVGSKTTDTIIVSSTGGYSGLVTLSASVSGPANAVAPTVSFAGSSNVTVASGTPGSAVLTITTAAPALAGSFRSNKPTYAYFGLPILLGMLFGVRGRRSTQWLCGFLLCLMAACVTGCGSGTTSATQLGTTPGTYTVTVTGNANGVSGSGTFTVTVQ